MSNNTANTETPLWKQGKNPDLKFANLKLLERQEPSGTKYSNTRYD